MQKTHVVMLLDESGSMGPYRKAVVDSFNNYLKELKNGTKRCWMSLYKFDRRMDAKTVRTVFENRKVKVCYSMTLPQYSPHGGTPLYDAIGILIGRTKKRLPKDAKVLFVVHTDGQENASSKHNQESIKRLIQKCENKRGWTFVYLGEGAEAWNAGYDFGIDNVANFSSSMRGAAMSKLAGSTMCYAARQSVGTTKSFYADAGVDADDIDPKDQGTYSSTVTNRDKATTAAESDS